MNTGILQEIDREIKRLQEARAVLAGASGAKSASTKAAGRKRKKRTLSAEARKRIAEAQKRRWAKAKGKATA